LRIGKCLTRSVIRIRSSPASAGCRAVLVAGSPVMPRPPR
jgi:hypothetical protein